MKLKLVTTPNPILRQKSKPIKKIDKKIKNLASNLIQTVKSGPEGQRIGEGLSAIQVGKPVRLFVVHLPKKKDFEVFINPTITQSAKKTNQKPTRLEGCLSVPKIYGFVKRPVWVKVKYQTLDGQWQEKKYTDLPKTIIQHEYDHLEGVLFIDHLLKQKGKIYKLEKDSQGQDILAETELI